MRQAHYIILFLLGGLLAACSEADFFSEFHSFPGGAWEKGDTVRFEVPVHDAEGRYQVLIQCRNDNRYPFRNIWLFIDYQTPGGSVRSDTLCTDLADAYGKWYGDGIGVYCYSFPYQLDVQYPDTGTYSYTIRQGMRADVLTGMTDVGLRVVKK
jgi:gliding motility-associated lipoprotein GldH